MRVARLASTSSRLLSTMTTSAAPATAAPSASSVGAAFDSTAAVALANEAGPSRSVREKWINPLGAQVPGGARRLEPEDDPRAFNAWDNVDLPAGFAAHAEAIMQRHAAAMVPDNLAEDYNSRPEHYWNKFYALHEDQFFKDRKWLALEFPQLIECIERDTILEVGCGAGNTVFPLLVHNENPDLQIYATDYSSRAIEVVQASELYPRAPHGLGVLDASVWDITSRPSASGTADDAAGALASQPSYSLPAGLAPGSVDVISCIYVLSALHPSEWAQAVHNLYTLLRPGGLLLVRDYGRHDLAQLRIKSARRLDVDNFYIRGDGTRVYFFDRDELGGLLTVPPRRYADGAGAPDPAADERNMFVLTELREDRRLIVNRKEDLQMLRRWLQVQARKL